MARRPSPLAAVITPRDEALKRVNRTLFVDYPITQETIDKISLAKLGIVLEPTDKVLMLRSSVNTGYILVEKTRDEPRFYCSNTTKR